MIDEELYQLASDELNSDQRRPDVWARACALASDDHDEARYLYTNLRVEQMLVDRNRPRKPRMAPADAEPAAAFEHTRNSHDETLTIDEAGGDTDVSPTIEFPEFDPDTPHRSPLPDTASPVIARDVSPEDITTHDFQSDDLTPDDFAAATIDMVSMDDTAIIDSGDAPVPRDQELPRREAGNSLPEPGADIDAVTGSRQSAAPSYWDDDDFTFELAPLDSPAEASGIDANTTTSPEASGIDTDATTRLEAPGIDADATTRLEAAGIDTDTTTRLSENDLAAFRGDSIVDDDDSDERHPDSVVLDQTDTGNAHGHEVTPDQAEFNRRDSDGTESGLSSAARVVDRLASTPSVTVTDLASTNHKQAAPPADDHRTTTQYDATDGINGTLLHREVHERSDREVHERSDREVHERSDREVHERSDREVHGRSDREVHEHSDREARGQADRQVPGKAHRETLEQTDQRVHEQADREASAQQADGRTAQAIADSVRAEEESEGPGRAWLIYRRGPDELRAVKKGVSWPALIATLPWLLSRMLLGTALVYSVLWLLLMAGLLVSGLAWLDAGTVVPLATKVLFAGFVLLSVIGLLYVPFRHANGWHARKLERRGFSGLRQLNARTAKAAVERMQGLEH